MGKMKEEFMRLHEIEMYDAPPFIWNGEVEYEGEDDKPEIDTEKITIEGLDTLFTIDEDDD